MKTVMLIIALLASLTITEAAIVPNGGFEGGTYDSDGKVLPNKWDGGGGDYYYNSDDTNGYIVVGNSGGLGSEELKWA